MAPTQSSLNSTGTGGGLAVGTRVMLSGLLRKPELNGHRGTVLRFEAGIGRYAVSLDGKQSGVLLKPECLDTEAARACDDAQRVALAKEMDVLEANNTPEKHAVMLKVLQVCQAERGLPVQEYGDSFDERLRFRFDCCNIAGIRPNIEACDQLQFKG